MMPSRRLVPCHFVIFILLLICITLLPVAVTATLDSNDTRNDTGQLSRSRRQLYGDDYYGSYYGWQASGSDCWMDSGLHCPSPDHLCTVCSTNNPIFSSSGGVIRRTVTDPPSPNEHRVVYAHASDRYFERRPRSPQQANTSSANNEYRRS
ncbi:hypothetical protein M3Y97_00390900 [Aphelenchoides bicaudatus]|nr:hypothetical protein M3Y97_00390900 [Aphelenchoides bicaudatus]